MKTFDFLRSRIFKIRVVRKMRGKFIKSLSVFNFVIYIRRGHCDFSPRGPKNQI